MSVRTWSEYFCCFDLFFLSFILTTQLNLMKNKIINISIIFPNLNNLINLNPLFQATSIASFPCPSQLQKVIHRRQFPALTDSSQFAHQLSLALH